MVDNFKVGVWREPDTGRLLIDVQNLRFLSGSFFVSYDEAYELAQELAAAANEVVTQIARGRGRA